MCMRLFPMRLRTCVLLAEAIMSQAGSFFLCSCTPKNRHVSSRAMGGVGAGIYRFVPSTTTAACIYPDIEMACISSRKFALRRLLLLSLALWSCWQLSNAVPKQRSSDHEQQHNVGGASCGALAVENPKRRSYISTCEQMAAPVPYLPFPEIVFVSANKHVPSGPELQSRLPMFFQDSPHVIFLLKNWNSESHWSYALCCCATLVLGLISVLLKGARRQLENKLQKSSGEVDAHSCGDKHHTETVNNVASAAGACSLRKSASSTQPTSSIAPATSVDAATTNVARDISRFAEKGTITSPAAGAGLRGENLDNSHNEEINGQRKDLEIHKKSQQCPHPSESCDRSGARESRGNETQAVCDSAQSIHFPVLLDTAAAAVGAPPPDGMEDTCCIRGQRHTVNNKPRDRCNPETGEANSRGIGSNIHKVKSDGSWLPAALQGFPVGPNAARAVAAFCNYFLDYLLMLLAMTFNVGIILCLLAGIAIGFLLIGHHLLPPPIQNHELEKNSHNSCSSATETTGSSVSSRKNVSNSSMTPIFKTGCSSAEKVEPNSYKHYEADKEAQMLQADGLLYAERSAEICSRTPPVAAQDDEYCCTYTGAVEGENYEEHQDKEREECHLNDKQEADECRTKKELSKVAAFGYISTAYKETGSRSSEVSNDSCLSVTGPSSEACAPPAKNGAGVSRNILVIRGAPAEEKANGKPREAPLQQNANLSKNTLGTIAGGNSYKIVGSRAVENGRGAEGNSNTSEKLRPLVMPPFAKGTASPATALGSPAGSGIQMVDADRKQELRHPRLLAGKEAQFQRRPSDCDDMLCKAENLKQLYPADFDVPWFELMATKDLKL